MKIIADENIPLVQELFGGWGEVVLMPGRDIDSNDVKQADILLVRSVTRVDRALLEHSRVKFVGTATTGTDHLDSTWLAEAGIAYASAAGANAEAVAEYVVCIIAALRQQKILSGSSLRAGVIGVGKVGSRVVKKLAALNFEVLMNDPPKALAEPSFVSVPLTEFRDLDLICLHTPLIKSGPYPSFHLIDKNFLRRQKSACVILNAGRGAVINFADLKQYGKHLISCLDVWEHEPQIDLDILQQATIATPHIAGYTAEAKLRGILMIYQAALTTLQLPPHALPASLESKIKLTITSSAWEDIVLQVYNPLFDTQQTKDALLSATNVAKQFDALRKHHPRRHEFNGIALPSSTTINIQLLKQLGFNFASNKE